MSETWINLLSSSARNIETLVLPELETLVPPSNWNLLLAWIICDSILSSVSVCSGLSLLWDATSLWFSYVPEVTEVVWSTLNMCSPLGLLVEQMVGPYTGTIIGGVGDGEGVATNPWSRFSLSLVPSSCLIFLCKMFATFGFFHPLSRFSESSGFCGFNSHLDILWFVRIVVLLILELFLCGSIWS